MYIPAPNSLSLSLSLSFSFSSYLTFLPILTYPHLQSLLLPTNLLLPTYVLTYPLFHHQVSDLSPFTLVLSLTHPLFTPLLTCLPIHPLPIDSSYPPNEVSSTHYLIHSLPRPHIPSSIHSLFHLFPHPPTPSSTHSLIPHSLIHSLYHSLVTYNVSLPLVIKTRK